MVELFYIYRETHRGYRRAYLGLKGTDFVWFETGDYDTWDECKLEAYRFTQAEAALALLTMKSLDVHREFEFNSEQH